MKLVSGLRLFVFSVQTYLPRRAPRYRSHCSVSSKDTGEISEERARRFKTKLSSGPDFHHFLRASSNKTPPKESQTEHEEPYLPHVSPASMRRVYFETYGCQMNVNDTEIAWSILQKGGYLRTSEVSEADVVLLVTCSIREKAEQTIWNRLRQLTALKKKRLKANSHLKIGILGCMAERLKTELLEKEKVVDVVVGPDAYRDLPRLLTVAHGGQRASNVLLSLEETYADIMPIHSTGHSAFVSIMRGCDNMCSFCVVPFTRGRERSRPLSSILEEVRMLSDQGVKEVTLLGQNVNSYRDISEAQFSMSEVGLRLSRGFSTVYRAKQGGLRFAELLDRVSLVDPDMRIRFTSPHPKDFPDEVLHLIQEKKNICKQIHLPAQSGSSRVLQTMRRGYTREAYLELVENIRKIIPGVSLSSDFITGFCGETEEDHHQTLSLLREVGYNIGFLFAYSMRKKTHAYHRLQDDVPTEVKQRRLKELISVFREEAAKVNATLIGSTQLVLVEGIPVSPGVKLLVRKSAALQSDRSPKGLQGGKESKRSSQELCGRNDGNLKVIFPKKDLPSQTSVMSTVPIKAGDYVLVKITSANSQSLRGQAISHTSLSHSRTTEELLNEQAAAC